MATFAGQMSRAAVAGPPSPLKPCTPVPATVVMIPSGLTFRTRLLSVSAMKRFPCPSAVTPQGRASIALVAGPPSPLKPYDPFPATVVMMPAGLTFRIR